MPDNSNGIHSLPPGYLAVTGQTIEASQHNPPLEDLSQSVTARLPRNGSAPMAADLPMGGFKVINMASGVASSDGATRGQLDNATPVGMITEYAGAVSPSGWLLCFGQAISRSTYSALFAVIGTVYGAGDNSTTFNVPDLRGRVTAGKDDMGGVSADRLTNLSGGVNGDVLGATGGAQSHVLTEDQLAPHNHSGSSGPAGGHGHPYRGSVINDGATGRTTTGGFMLNNNPVSTFAAYTGAPSDAAGQQIGGAPDHLHTIPTSGIGQAHNNVQPTAILNKIIRSGV